MPNCVSVSDDDALLLASYAESGDQAIFRQLVHRHQALVYRVCLSVVHVPADAEDAMPRMRLKRPSSNSRAMPLPFTTCQPGCAARR